MKKYMRKPFVVIICVLGVLTILFCNDSGNKNDIQNSEVETVIKYYSEDGKEIDGGSIFKKGKFSKNSKKELKGWFPEELNKKLQKKHNTSKTEESWLEETKKHAKCYMTSTTKKEMLENIGKLFNRSYWE